jgi:small subunit ribosomal protein S17
VRQVRRDIARVKTIAAQKRAGAAKPRRSDDMPKRMLQGVVVSDKQDKTRVVRVERRFTHPVMKKTVRRTKKYYAHDEKNEHHVGDIVWIEERRPLSRLKRWEVVRGREKQGNVTRASAQNEGCSDDPDADQP